MGKDWGEKFRTLASICAIVMFFGGAIAWAFKLLPVASASEMRAVQVRVDRIETGFKAMSLKQTESLELQLMQQIDRVTDKLQAMGRGAPEYGQLRDESVQISQRLSIVRAELAVLRSSQ